MKDDYSEIFETLQLDSKTLEIGHGETITPPFEPSDEKIDPMESLPRFTMEMKAVSRSDADFRIVDTLGEGGMGVVSLAEQTALRRLVAVKEPKGGNAQAYGRVLDEAFIMGRMEHPNVVPAYSLGRRENGTPILVMKRVEGTSWEDVIAGNADVPDGHEPDLGWHLRVLLQVCNALRFAHARHVVHRDIKPENVMIGEFGEVYLLDWGIALSLDADADDGLPTAATSRGVAGTPAFMAPEMTDDDASDIDERTDIYLLGANLHLILTGEPPHAGTTLFEVCMSAFQSEPRDYGDDVPTELAHIAQRAMAREKADRYQSVGEFSDAVADFLEHRASYTLSDSARELLDELRGDESVEASTRLLEADFGFRQALKIWAGNEAAQLGLQEAVEERVRSCITREEVGGARAAIDQLPAPNPELQARLEALEAELAQRAERVDYLERFEKDLDLRTGTRSRQRAVVVIGLGFTALCFWQAWEARPGQPVLPVETWLTSYWRLVGIAVAGIALFWKKLVANVANRRLVAFFVSALLGMLLLRIGGVKFNPDPMFAMVAEMVVIWMATFAIGIASSRVLAAVSALSYGAAVLLGIYSAQMWVALAALGVAHLVFFSFTGWLWSPSRTR